MLGDQSELAIPPFSVDDFAMQAFPPSTNEPSESDKLQATLQSLVGQAMSIDDFLEFDRLLTFSWSAT
jgi:hypothetical protein